MIVCRLTKTNFIFEEFAMLYVAISIVLYALISNADGWYRTFKWYQISSMIKRGWIDSPDGRRLKIEK